MNIKTLIMDVDGTLTDGKIYMGCKGEACKAFNIRDGYGIHDILIPKGIRPVIITGRYSEIVKNRCGELGIKEVHQGITDKLEKMREILKKWDLEYENAAYIGDDLNDLPCMELLKKFGGAVGCPKDADRKVIDIADFLSIYNGGDGAVREFIEWILSLNDGLRKITV